jgi:hypothetical protein
MAQVIEQIPVQEEIVMKQRLITLLIAIIVLSISSPAEVKDSAANGFTIVSTFTAKGSPSETYRKILAVADWWSSAHTFSGDAHNLTIDAKAGGCWCESLPKIGGSVAHMRVATAFPGTMLVMIGGLGPLQSMGASGAMTFKLSPAEGGTKVEFLYVVTGYHPQGMNSIASGVDSVLMEAVSRLHSYLDTGNPEPKK